MSTTNCVVTQLERDLPSSSIEEIEYCTPSSSFGSPKSDARTEAQEPFGVSFGTEPMKVPPRHRSKWTLTLSPSSSAACARKRGSASDTYFGVPGCDGWISTDAGVLGTEL